MPRKKLLRFEKIKTFPNVFDEHDPLFTTYVSELFRSDREKVLELGCGSGKYCLELAKIYPNKVFIGVDIKGERIWIGAKECLENSVKNVFFIRTHVEKLIGILPKGSISEIWITFPDPRPRKREEKYRLIFPRYLEIYKTLLINHGTVHLKTDAYSLIAYAEQLEINKKIIIHETIDSIYDNDRLKDELYIKTYFEEKALTLGCKIKYLKFEIL